MIGSIRHDNAFFQAASQAVSNAQSTDQTAKRANKDDKIETSRVAEIKEALAKGEYKIDIGGSAAKMARNLLGK